MILTIIQNGYSSDERETCSLFKGNHTITVTKADENGHKCNGIIAIAVCGGMCSSSEKGTHFFPHRENENSACVPIETTPIRHELTNCEEEALPTARWIEFNETKQCGCKSIDNPSN
uniref:Uncharacterized protein n=1 Tax=Panagrolaimus superbus TaxID=310955 RepID=A0A914Y4Z6_9BILA